MSIELRVPQVGESITEVEIGGWLKANGESVRKDEPVVSLESEKATVELPAPEAGVLVKILKQKGEVAKIGEVIGILEPGGGAPAVKKATEPAAAKPAATALSAAEPKPVTTEPRVMPAAQRLMADHNIQAEQVKATGPGGRLLKEDVLHHLETSEPQATPASALPKLESAQPATELPSPTPPEVSPRVTGGAIPGRQEETVPMSRLRRTVAERLVEAQHSAALLTTFNEVDMTNVIGLRKEYGEGFLQKYGIKLGFMSFFIKAAVDALKQYPVLNAEVRGTNIVYHNYYDIGVAIGSGKGLVVPVLRNAEHLSFSQIELTIAEFSKRAKENKLKIDELQGGTFTISNGGVYGSMLSTPIVNPPQSGVLGMHAIQDRPMARDGNVVIRPIMYLALTYDHRIVDGREAVSFVRRIKDVIENPARMLMEI
jgi:2-oxoglutarate dehydrogenase E2 component (dihydrolipoamide succinyltransferase)